MLLSVQKKASRLAVLGEIGRYPLLLSALANVFKYEHSLRSRQAENTVISSIFREMENYVRVDQDCWLTRVQKIKDGINIKVSGSHKNKNISHLLKKQLNSKFEKLWLDSINLVKMKNGHDSNKLRFYKCFKGSFKQEPYISLVNNRNQRCQLSRVRISAHNLAIERSRYSTEYIPPEMRKCTYCTLECTDSEVHFLTQCPTFEFKRNCYKGKMKSVGINIDSYDSYSQAAIMLCPTTAKQAKITNKFIDIMFKTREQVDEGATTIECIKINNFHQPTDEYDDKDSTFNNISLDSNFDIETDD